MFNKSTFFNRENRNEDKKRTLNHVKKDLIVIPLRVFLIGQHQLSINHRH